ncbi:MAG: SOS response-associated peptidase [Nitrospira sp.]|nr:SOS response-associated peptidase [Nitrospira sp.]
MCGRFTQTASPQVIAEQFQLKERPLFTARYNIAPSQSVAAIWITPEASTRACVLLRWGLIPSWATNPKIGAQCINAKAETVAEKPAFRAAFKKRRCLVIADGFYEWQPQGNRKQPMWIGLKTKMPFAFAGLWEHWQPAEGAPVETCTIITTEANAFMQPVHARMPVILPPSSYHQWLDPGISDVTVLNSFLRPYPSEDLTAYPVSTLVNSPRNDVRQCLEPLAG